MRAFTALFFIFHASSLMASDNIDPGLKEYIVKTLGTVEIAGVSEGKLKNSNGVYSLVTIIYSSTADAKSEEVLFKNNNGSYTKVLNMKYLGGPTGLAPYFKNGSLFLYSDQSCGSVCHTSQSFQFQYRNGDYKLIGIENSSAQAVNEEILQLNSRKKLYLVSRRTSINFPASDVEYYLNICPVSDKNPWYCIGKSKSISKRLKFNSIDKWNLENFDEFELIDSMQITKNLNGYIGTDFNYHENP